MSLIELIAINLAYVVIILGLGILFLWLADWLMLRIFKIKKNFNLLYSFHINKHKYYEWLIKEQEKK